jgi:hypothetical protein
MPRHTEPDLRKDWKISLPATLAGSVEFELMDPTTKKPRYAERSRLIAALLADWLSKRGKTVEVDMPAEDLYKPAPKEEPHDRTSQRVPVDLIDPVLDDEG